MGPREGQGNGPSTDDDTDAEPPMKRPDSREGGDAEAAGSVAEREAVARDEDDTWGDAAERHMGDDDRSQHDGGDRAQADPTDEERGDGDDEGPGDGRGTA